jgi:shikimate kinase
VTTQTPIIVLVGLMGTGKSTIARLLSSRLGLDCLDTDKLVEDRTGKSVREIFDELGEQAFRDIESEVVVECLDRGIPTVVAAAGGIVLRAENRLAIEKARNSGRVTVVWLHARPEVLTSRTKTGTHRPLLDEDRAGTLERLSEERGPLYASVADVIIDVSDRSAESTVDLLIDALDEAARYEEGSNG